MQMNYTAEQFGQKLKNFMTYDCIYTVVYMIV